MFTKIFVVLSVLLVTDLFGSYDPSLSLIIPGVGKAYDVTLILAMLPFIISLMCADNYTLKVMKTKPAIIIIIFFSLVLVVGFNTYTMGGTSVKSILQISRYYLFYALIFVIIYNASISSIQFYRRFLIIMGTISTAFLIITVIFRADWFLNWPLFKLGYLDIDYLAVRRVYFKAFTFTVFCAVLKFWDFVITKKTTDFILFLFFFIGLALQGFRSYFFGAFIAIFLVETIRKLKYGFNKSGDLKLFNYLIAGATISAGIFILHFSGIMTLKYIWYRILSIVTDISWEDGTYGYRIMEDTYRWSLVKENPLLGVGMVHPGSIRAILLGIQESGRYSLDTTDSGYLEILVRFGIAGLLYFIYFTYSMVKYCISVSENLPQRWRSFALSTATFILLIMITQISHGGFTGQYGIVPIAMSLGIVEAAVLRYTKNPGIADNFPQ